MRHMIAPKKQNFKMPQIFSPQFLLFLHILSMWHPQDNTTSHLKQPCKAAEWKILSGSYLLSLGFSGRTHKSDLLFSVPDPEHLLTCCICVLEGLGNMRLIMYIWLYILYKHYLLGYVLNFYILLYSVNHTLACAYWHQ